MDTVDLVVIGGGITGVGIAQRAQAAGYSVAVLEKGEIGQATSSNSSKLIHGGLRYLESGQISLVRESLAQRKALLLLAPTLVKPVPFYIPIYQGSQRGPLAIRAGLSMYALLSEFDALGQFKSIAPKEWGNLFGLKLQGLRAVFRYWDAQTDDHALTLAVADSAKQIGARIHTSVEIKSIEHQRDACTIHYKQNSLAKSLKALCIINASGPWVNKTLELVQPKVTGVDIELVQGSHLVLDIPPPDGILYLESIYDKRVVFVMPWKGKTMIGTTETPVDDADEVGVTQAETQYLLGIYRHYFPFSEEGSHLADKVIGNYCGMRVLPKQQVDAFDLPRETLMNTRVTHPRLMTIYGGKLTTFRHTAKDAVEWVEKQIGQRAAVADVDQLKLCASTNHTNNTLDG